MGIDNLLYNYRYYAAPEGTDPLGKLVGLCKYGVIAGLVTSTLDCTLLEPHRPNLAAVANNVAFWTIPLTGMCAAFASTAYIAASVRKKDDSLNYILGSVATGGVFHAWLQNTRASVAISIFTMIYSVSKKEFELSGLPLIEPKLKRNHGVWWDYTLWKDPRSTGWEPRARRYL